MEKASVKDAERYGIGLLNRTFLVSILVLFSFLFLYFVYSSFTALAFPYDIDYGEGIHLYYATMLADGRDVYNDIHSYPFIACNYPPIYPVISAFAVTILGPSFFSGRIVSFIASLLIGFLIYLLVREETGNRSAGVFSFLVFFSSPYVVNWSTFFRVDMLALFFSFLGIYIFYAYGKTKSVYLSIPVFILAFYTKQSSLIAPAAVFLYMSRENRKKSFYWLLTYIACLAAVFLVIDYLTGGEFFLHLLVYNLLSADVVTGVHIDFLFVFLNLVFLVLGIFYLRLDPKSLFGIYFFFSFCSSLVISSKAGSSFNYFIELVAVTSVVSALFLNKAGFFSGFADKAPHWKNFYGIVWFVLLIVQFSVIVIALQNPSSFLIQGLPDRAGSEKINGYVASAEAPVLVEYNGYAILNHKGALLDSFLMSELEKKGLWDSSLLVSDCMSKKFSVIILSDNLYSVRGLPQCVYEYYTLEDEIQYKDHLVARVYTRK